jgi:transposase
VSHPASEPDRLADRRAAEWKLRVRGWSIREIAKHFGISSTTVHDDLEVIRLELADNTKEAVLKYREIELARVDEWIRAGTEQLESLGDIRSIEEAADDADAKIRVDTIAPLLNSLKGLSERRSKLLGLDHALKTELSGPEGGPVKVEDSRNALLAKLSGLAAGIPTETETEGDTKPTK